MNKTKTQPSTFLTWFIEQHGDRPSNKPTHELIEDKNNKVVVAENARRLVAACDLWDEKKTSALYAWQASRSILTKGE